MSASQSVVMIFATLFVLALVLSIGVAISTRIISTIDTVHGTQTSFVPAPIKNLWNSVLPLVSIIFIVIVAGVIIKLITSLFRTD